MHLFNMFHDHSRGHPYSLKTSISKIHVATFEKITLNAKCSVVEKFRVFRALGGNRETFTPKNGLILLIFKCNTAKLFRRNTNVHVKKQLHV